MAARHKGIELDERLLGLIHHMASVEEYREQLQILQGTWDNLTLLGQLSGTGTDMTTTRQAFGQLTGSLLNNLGIETLRKKVSELQSKAQVAVDIMIRNLFERTADIGFLATDDDIRRFCVAVATESGDESSGQRQALAEALVVRFQEYVRKYSVYFNIILMDCRGRVLVQLDPDNPVRESSDPLIARSLETGAEYVECFGPTDLLPGGEPALIYAYRVSSGAGDAPLGVLCLCFRFRNETEGIFDNLLGGRDDWCLLALLDTDGRVIASSEPWHVPVGACLERVLDREFGVVRFAGRQYLATTRATRGYQGFMGLGWYGHAMVPLEHAFAGEVGRMQDIDPEVLAAVMDNPTLFSDALRRIPEQAERIQRELNRSVWNGNVRQSSDRKAINPAFSKVLLWEISNTGLRTKEVFESSIGNLHETVVSSILQDSLFLSSLAIDIMDRNLYERANDCRWWALTTAFREMLAVGQLSEGDVRHMNEILSYINSLYTVYDKLVVFDRNGRIVAGSTPASQSFVGRVLQDEWVRRTLALESSQSYAVSAFEPSSLYDQRHTYIYAAAIRGPGSGTTPVVGGIGIVFDSEPQFRAMLGDALPRNAGDQQAQEPFAVFADRQRRVVASTREDLPAGCRLDLDSGFFGLGNGVGRSDIVTYGEHYFAVGARVSRGYREYKGPEDAYHNDIVSLVFMPLGPTGEPAARRREGRARLQFQASRGAEYGESTEIATFYIGSRWFGIRSRDVVEAIDLRGVTPIPGAMPHVRGYVMYGETPTLVVDLRGFVKGEEKQPPDPAAQIVVVRLGEGNDLIGLLVDRLGEIPEVPNHRIERLSAMFAGEGILGESIVKPEEPSRSAGQEMLVVLSPETIRQRLVAARFQAPGALPDPRAALAAERRPG